VIGIAGIEDIVKVVISEQKAAIHELES